jgi:hypothetical protein
MAKTKQNKTAGKAKEVEEEVVETVEEVVEEETVEPEIEADEDKALEAENDPVEPEVEQDVEVVDPQVQTSIEPESSQNEVVQYYRKQAILRIENTLVNGKLYKTVVCTNGTTYQLTPEELAKEVK